MGGSEDCACHRPARSANDAEGVAAGAGARRRPGLRAPVAERGPLSPIQADARTKSNHLQCVSKDAATTGGVSWRPRRECDAGRSPGSLSALFLQQEGVPHATHRSRRVSVRRDVQRPRCEFDQRRPRTQAWGRPEQRREVARFAGPRLHTSVSEFVPLPWGMSRYATHLGRFTGKLTAGGHPAFRLLSVDLRAHSQQTKCGNQPRHTTCLAYACWRKGQRSFPIACR